MIRLHPILSMITLAMFFASARAIGEQPPPRNLIWITIEDMSPWIGCYGDDSVPTPNLDRLAETGVRYTNAFATTPVCAPSRSTLITGCWATRIGSMHMRTGKPSVAALERNPTSYAGIPDYEAVPPPAVRCFPELLRAAGWFCTNRAKTDYQFKAPETTWDLSGGRAHWRRRADANQPFFAVFNLGVTHESGTFPTRKQQPTVCDPSAVMVPPYLPDTPQTREDIARTYDNIAAMDRQIGILIDEVEQAGLLDDTAIMIFSDHGVGLPRGKRCVYDSGTRVPLIIRWPEVFDRRGVEDRVVSFEDFAPTALSILGVEAPPWMDGVPFAGEFQRDDDGFAYLHADRMDAVRDRTRAITDGRYRYVRNLMPDRPRLYDVAYAENIPMKAEIHRLRASGKANAEQWQITETTKPPEEFYDTHEDPHEVRNRIDDPEHGSRIQLMRRRLDEWIQATGDLGLIEDEGEMVRTRLWSGARRKPRTAPPVLLVREKDDERIAEISCVTNGASIGFRWGGNQGFALVNGPLPLPATGGILEVLTHRIGFQPRVLRWSISPAED